MKKTSTEIARKNIISRQNYSDPADCFLRLVYIKKDQRCNQEYDSFWCCWTITYHKRKKSIWQWIHIKTKVILLKLENLFVHSWLLATWHSWQSNNKNKWVIQFCHHLCKLAWLLGIGGQSNKLFDTFLRYLWIKLY